MVNFKLNPLNSLVLLEELELEKYWEVKVALVEGMSVADGAEEA